MALGTQNLLVSTDFSASSQLAIDAAAMLAKQFGAKVHLVHVYDPSPLAPIATRGSGAGQLEVEREVEDRIREELGRLRDGTLAGVDVQPQVLQSGSPADAICKYAAEHDIDIIVCSTHGRTGLAHLLIGSVAEKIVRHAPCPVLTLRSKAG
jgi:universal stress protein A